MNESTVTREEICDVNVLKEQMRDARLPGKSKT